MYPAKEDGGPSVEREAPAPAETQQNRQPRTVSQCVDESQAKRTRNVSERPRNAVSLRLYRDAPEVLRPVEAARLLSRSESYVRQLVAEGYLTNSGTANKVLIPKYAIRVLLRRVVLEELRLPDEEYR